MRPTSTSPIPLNDAIATAAAKLVDDAQAEKRREPSHADIDFLIRDSNLSSADPKNQGPVGKGKRVRAVLYWAIGNDLIAGKRMLAALIEQVRGKGGFRSESPHYVGSECIFSLSAAFLAEGYELTSDGLLRQRLLDNLTGAELSDALKAYVRRAKAGADDAALVTGTGKDLMEAVAAHILSERYGGYSATSNFPTLLGQTFFALGLHTPEHLVAPNEPSQHRLERTMFDMACAINRLRNTEGTGHGRPWSSTVTNDEARFAVESMGAIAEYLLARHSVHR
jgi:hypothetical protein